MTSQSEIQKQVRTVLTALIIQTLFAASLFAETFSGLPPLNSPSFSFSTKNLVEVSATISPEQVKPGSSFHLNLRVVIAGGSHIYSLEEQLEKNLASRVDLTSTEFLPNGNWKESPPQIALDEVFQRVVKTHGDLAEFSRKYQIPSTAKLGEVSISGTFTYRLCNNKTCSMPQFLEFQAPLQIIQKGPTSE